MEKYIEDNGKKFLIRKAGSIYTNRNGKRDIVIKRRNDSEQGAHGSRESDGRRIIR